MHHPPALVPDLAWSCIRCGRSCQDWTEIEIEPPEANRLRRLPLFHPDLPPPESDDELPYVAGSRVDGQILLRLREGRDGSRCVLQTDGGLCAVHAAHGEPAKPASCRSFPFAFITSPTDRRVAVSFACTALTHELGEPLADQAELIERTDGIAHHRERRGRDLRLAPGTPLAWADYQPLEAALLAIVDREPTVADALGRQADLLRRTAGWPAADPCPSSRLRRHALRVVTDLAGRPPRFRRPIDGLEPPQPERLLRRWLRHRIWRRDLLRGDEVLFAHGLLSVEIALAREWAAQEPGGIAEAVVQVERGLGLHSDLVARIDADPRRREMLSRLLQAPRLQASLG